MAWMILWNVIDEYVCVKLNVKMAWMYGIETGKENVKTKIEKSGAYWKYEMRKGKENGNGKCDENVMIT